MTVNVSTITSGPYTGNNTTTSFSYSFKVQDKNEVIVYETDLAGVVTLLTVDTNYVVNNIGSASGGTVTRVAGALPNGYTWYLRSNYADLQDVDFTSQGAFYPNIHEQALDRRTYVSLQQHDLINRTIRLPDSYSGNADLQLPTPEADKGIYWNATGDALVNGLTASQIQTSESSAATSATNAATSEANAQTAFNDFDTRYLGAKAVAPTLDNQGNVLADGALYFDTVLNLMRVYDLGNTTWVHLPATTASGVTNTPAGNIAATNVQAAINELDVEKEPVDATILKQVDIGTTANKLVQMDATAKLPAVDGSQLTNLPIPAQTAPTTAEVGAATAGSTVYAIGSYGLGSRGGTTNAPFTPGSIYSGSSINLSVGSWRSMGYSLGSSSNDGFGNITYTNYTVFLRVA